MILLLSKTFNDVFQIGSPEAVLPGEMVVIDLKKGLEMVLHTAVIIRILRVSWGDRSYLILRCSERSIP